MATSAERFDWLNRGRARWLVVAACFLILFVVKGTVSTYGVFITPIEADFGWSRTTISATFTIYLLATAVASPITGRLIDTYGPSRTIPVFIALVALPLVALSSLSSVAHLYVLYAIIGLSVTGLALSHFSSLITKWFTTRTMLVTGVALSGASLGRLVFNPVAAEVILTRGWRTAYLAFGLLSLGAIPVAYFLVKRPRAVSSVDIAADEPEVDEDATAGQEPTEETEDATETTDASQSRGTERSVPVSTALRTPSLWLLVGTFAICGFTTVGLMTTHFVPYLVSIGFTESTAAQGAGVLGGMTVFGLLAMGAVGDRYDSKKRPLLASVYFFRGVTLLFLLAIATVVHIYAFAAVYGFLTLCTIPLHAGITADRFGPQNLTTLVGLQYAGHQVGGATAALAAGWIFETMGSYQWAYLLGVGLLMVAPVLVLGDRLFASTSEPA
jgi:MFS family permease